MYGCSAAARGGALVAAHPGPRPGRGRPTVTDFRYGDDYLWATSVPVLGRTLATQDRLDHEPGEWDYQGQAERDENGPE